MCAVQEDEDRRPAESMAEKRRLLHTQVGRWLKVEAHFDDTQASRFCAKLQELGLSSTHGLKVLDEEDHRQLARDLNMNMWVPLLYFVRALDSLVLAG